IVTALLLAVLALVHYPAVRLRLRNALPPTVGYNPDSILHITAIVIAAIYLSLEFHAFVLIGGIQGVVEELEGGIDPQNLWFQVAFYLSVSLLGVGLFSRRTWPQVLERLGLTSFSFNDIKQGVGMGIAMYGLMIALNIIGVIFFPQSPEIAYDEILSLSTPESILSFGFLIALTAAISEEILFRGALQPVFGITLTSLFFALTHLQYTFTWASVIIFFVSLGFGYVRQHTSTTAAIIAHFVYNFVPFLLLASLS
ncbi:MAG: CPBP family intramembrane metalloprotease, partial [Chloroflexi bacterium]